jgi:hypothetical protein
MMRSPVLALLLLATGARADQALFTPADRARLVRAISQNRGSAAEFAWLKGQADEGLSARPHPIRKIQTQHKLAGDPDKLATQRALRDMDVLFALGYAYDVTGDDRYAAQARTFILAWAKTNVPTGEPIDETNLEPLLVAYDLTRAAFPPDERAEADRYLRALIAAEWGARQLENNWQSHRLKIVGLAAYALGDQALIDRALAGFRRQIGVNLKADGSSVDFQLRDALHYHVYDLEPLLTLAIAAQKHGLDLYDYTAGGASLRNSVRWLLPYCTGEKQHAEFVHSTVAFDRARGANGQKDYESGHLYEPKEALRTLCLAAYFDPAVNPVIARLAAGKRDPKPAWVLLLNAAGHAGAPGT